MAGIKAARKIQLGKEVSTKQGTEANATTVWRGTGTIQDNLTTVFPTEDIGILTGVDRSYIPKVEASLSLDQTEATFQQLPYLFEMGIRSVTPTTNGDGSIFTYTIPVQSTDMLSSTDLQTFTVEAGDNQQEEQFLFGFARSINLSGSAGQALMMSAEIVGRQVAPGTFTSGVAIPTVEEILFSKGKLYIDAAGTYPATTEVSNTLLSMDLSINTGWIPVYTASGALYFSFIKQTSPEITCTITFEHNATSVAEKAAWRAGTARSIKIYFEGANAAASNLSLNMSGKWDNFEKLGEQDGNDIVTGTFRCRYNSSNAGFFQAIVENTLESLP